ncbi:MAG: hypothetical protein MJE68_31090 [Proteobacteria bacterium]|nr:hypothetical protein [Pseudomonadota bacterium]
MVTMVMRTIPPLEDHEWDALVADLEKGPSDEQAKFVREAIDLANTFNVSNDD